MENNFGNLLIQVIHDTTHKSLGHFSPELALCATIIALLLVRLCSVERWVPTHWVALFGSLLAFGCTYFQFVELRQGNSLPEEFFTGLLVYDQFAVFFRMFLLLFLILVIALTVLSGIPDIEDSPDFYALLLGAVIGMMLMASANHLLILFLAVEMASVPSYVMVGFLKGRRRSSEAALKFVVYGAGAAGVMLYGISLLAGLLGTANLPELASRLNALLGDQHVSMTSAEVRTVVLAVMMVLIGLAFKLSIVPFHFWCPDAFEGASAEVAGFLSVASKAGAFALLVRFCLAFTGTQPAETLRNVYLSLGIGLGVIAAVTATFGNFAAYAQTNMKRLLAYSTIAHAGYMLMAVSGMIVLLNGPDAASSATAEAARDEAARCLHGLMYYLFVYLFMNLGAFAIVALIRNEIFSEEIEDYNGLGYQAPVLCICMAICLFSLVGMPPMGGFWAKVFILVPVWSAGSIHWSMYAIVVVALLNTVFSLFYYVRVLKAMFLTSRPEGAREIEIPFNPTGAYVVLISALPILYLGICVQRLSETAQGVAAMLIP